jgi:hypothetical protein
MPAVVEAVDHAQPVADPDGDLERLPQVPGGFGGAVRSLIKLGQQVQAERLADEVAACLARSSSVTQLSSAAARSPHVDQDVRQVVVALPGEPARDGTLVDTGGLPGPVQCLLLIARVLSRGPGVGAIIRSPWPRWSAGGKAGRAQSCRSPLFRAQSAIDRPRTGAADVVDVPLGTFSRASCAINPCSRGVRVPPAPIGGVCASRAPNARRAARYGSRLDGCLRRARQVVQAHHGLDGQSAAGRVCAELVWTPLGCPECHRPRGRRRRGPSAAATSRHRSRDFCHFAGYAAPVIVVDPGSAVDPGYWGAPDRPPSPYPPQ